MLVRRRLERTVRGGMGIVLLLLMLRLRRVRRVLRMWRPSLSTGGESCMGRRNCGVLIGLRSTGGPCYEDRVVLERVTGLMD